ncbi:MAG: T9SS type A sorting domain-containing protein [Bacteroidetes bacterium]|nr:MAG: T9SS type A sorting domain-containing protein [Bacteroidota bacterium]
MSKKYLANRMKIKFILLIITIVALYVPLQAQSDSLIFDTKGTDFWLVFPPNFHNGKYSGSQMYYDDSLYIFITSDRPTTGVIEYMSLKGRTYSKNFSITDPTKIYTFSIFYPDFELLGYNDSGYNLDYQNNSEVITKLYFHILADNEITVYAHNQAVTTSDACLVFPTDILGKDYFIMSYNSDGKSDFGYLSTSSTPSQFVILATEDNTNVIIKPKQPTRFNGLKIQNIVLNTGDAYLVQADITETSLRTDLTGSEVHSDKPVAVFAGHQRSTVPNSPPASNPSRDYLLEQMPPIETWGQNALLIPYQQPSNATTLRNDIYRILAANNNTEIFINDVSVGKLNKDEFYEGQLTSPAHVRSNAPILVAQFKKTSDFTSSGGNNNYGDPFEMLIPPVEQFMTNYRVINTQAHEGIFSEAVYVEQFIIIVATDSSMASVLLDGNPIQLSFFKPIPTTKYFYANVRVSDGVHSISCNDKIGVYVYGYGPANSYGYVGGMSMKPYDYSPPQIVFADSCYSLRGTISDTLVSDSKINTIISAPESQVNVNVIIEQFNPYARQVKFSAKLNNFYEDGEFEIIATDSMGLSSTKKFEIPGFTLSVQNFRNGTKLPDHSKIYRIGKEFCYPVVIENYGKHNQNINDLILKNNTSNFRIVYNTPKTLNPGQIDTAFVCFNSPVDTNIIDTLSIVGDCGIRKIQSFNLTFRGDTNKPAVKAIVDPCNKTTNLVFTDSTIIDFGMASVDIIDTVNCLVTIEKFLPKYETVKIEVLDRYKDAIYHLSATDSAGFVTDVIDTIQGFTIAFPEINAGTNLFDYDSTMIGIINCKMLKVSNTGLLPITFDKNMYLTGNIIFSLPSIQLPFTINPGDIQLLNICFSPVHSAPEIQFDTLVLEFNCLAIKINILGLAEPFITDSKSKCNIPVVFTMDDLTSESYLGQSFPNPASDYSSFMFGLAENNYISLKIYDIYGAFRQTIFSGTLNRGNYKIQINTVELEQGVYFYTLTTENNNFTKTMVIRK